MHFAPVVLLQLEGALVRPFVESGLVLHEHAGVRRGEGS